MRRNTSCVAKTIRRIMLSYCAGLLFLIASSALMLAQTYHATRNESMEHTKHLEKFQIIEFRGYTIKEPEREHFARYFESYFPEAFEQLGAIVFGSFLERRNRSHFTW